MKVYEPALQLLISNSGLLVTREQFMSAILRFAPSSWVDDDFEPKTYHQEAHEEMLRVTSQSKVLLSDSFSDNMPAGTLAYHRIRGIILSDSRWTFSSKDFELNLLAAEANENIFGHFIHISSGGGEAWYLDRVSETLSSLKKPVYTLIDQVCASAAYYIGCHGSVVAALTQNDCIGSIGTMVYAMDFTPYYKKLGINFIEEYATKSTLKNKKHNDLLAGKPDQYIEEELDPLQVQFEKVVRASRSALANLPEDHPVFAGETYSAILAVENGLIDKIVTLPEALEAAAKAGEQWAKQQKQKKAISFIH